MIGVIRRNLICRGGRGAKTVYKNKNERKSAHDQLRFLPADNIHPTLKPWRRVDGWLRSGRVISTNYAHTSVNEQRRIFEHSGWVGESTASKGKLNARGSRKGEDCIPLFASQFRWNYYCKQSITLAQILLWSFVRNEGYLYPRHIKRIEGGLHISRFARILRKNRIFQ